MQALGIPVVLDQPGVGENLQDHLQLRLIYKVSGVKTLNETYRSLVRPRAHGRSTTRCCRTGPLTMAPSQLGMFTRSDPGRERANIQFHVQPLSLDKFGDPLHAFPAFTAASAMCSRRAAAPCGCAPPIPPTSRSIKPNYLSTDEDRRVAADSIRVARRIVGAAGARQAISRSNICRAPSVGDDDAALIKAAGDIGTTIFHPVGTAKMGRATDPTAVVDERLRVIGLERLRIVDASVMPTITSGNTNAPTMMIAEKGAAMMREDRRG